MSAAVVLEDLCREYRAFGGRARTVALDGFNCSIGRGELFGLLGPNGAGKTTTIKILTTLLLPTSGTARVLGHNVAARPGLVRPLINYVFGGERGLYWRLTGRENLYYFASLYKVPPRTQRRRVAELLEIVGLTQRADSRVETYSRGMKQRLHIARGLVNDPRVVFLDEPTIGLDPEAARELRTVVSTMRDRGVTVVLCTHYMAEADQLCDRIAIINRGRLVAQGSPDQLKQFAAGIEVVEFGGRLFPTVTLQCIRALPGVQGVSVEDRGVSQVLSVRFQSGDCTVSRILDELRGISLTRVTEREATLEDAYLRLVGGSGAVE